MSADEPEVYLSARERAVLTGLADGLSMAEVALGLRISQTTANGYLRSARHQLYQASEIPQLIAIAYTVEAIPRPQERDLPGVALPGSQRRLVPLVAEGLSAAQMGARLLVPVDEVRREARALLETVDARTRPHFVTRAWAYRLLTAEQVWAWLRRNEALREVADVLAQGVAGRPLPAPHLTVEATRRLVGHGLAAANELRSLRGKLSTNAHAVAFADFTLADAERRLHQPPPCPTAPAMMQRAQSVARLVRALHTAIDRTTSELAAQAQP